MKKFFKFIFVLLILLLGLLAINNETDFFEHIGNYIPAIEEKYPAAAEKISNISNDIAAFSHQIPSWQELKALIKGEEPPIDPSDAAANAYVKDSPLLSFCPNENISIRVDGSTLEIFGIVDSYNKSNLVVCLNESEDNTVVQESVPTDSSYEFYRSIEIPEDYDKYDVAVYTGSKPYGSFTSWVYNYVTVQKNGYGVWEIPKSPVYEHNAVMYEKEKSLKAATQSTVSIQSEYDNMKALASELCENCVSAYDKALALHDWIAGYLYYDNDSLYSDTAIPYNATSVVNSRRAVCLGYATLYATLCRATGIPCNVVSGYALGVASGKTEWDGANIETKEQNHAWNEVYLDGRWVIVDVTWDCSNKYEDGSFNKGEEPSHLYFDANLEFFSANHKILEYTTRR